MAGKPRFPAWWVAAAVGAILVVLMVLRLWFWVAAGLILIAALLGWRFHNNDRSERSQGLAAALSVLVLFFGAYWYTVERPGAAKLDLVLAGQGFRTVDGALVFLSVDVENVGNTPVSFEGEAALAPAPASPRASAAAPSSDADCRKEERMAASAPRPSESLMKVRIGKVRPVTAGLRERLACATLAAPGDAPVPLARADLWPPVARVDQLLITKIEAGEKEKYYYRFAIPCEPGLVLSATARIAKRGTFTDALVQKEPAGQVWIAQTLIDLTGICEEEGGRDEAEA